MTMSSTNNSSTIAARVSAIWRRRDAVVLIILLLFVVIGLAGLAAATGWQEVSEQLAKLSLFQFAALLGLSVINYAFRSLRWHLFATNLGLGTGLVQNARHFLGGFAMSVTPGRIGELVRMRWIRRETEWSFEKTAPLVLVDRASDLAAMAVILGLAVSFSATGINGALPVTFLALLTAVIATRPQMLAATAGIGYRIFGRWPRLFARVRSASRSLAQFSSPGTIGLACAIGAIGWFAEGYAFHLLLMWMGIDIGLAKAMAIFIFATLAGGLTGAPGGVGGAEAAMIALLSLEGVPLNVSVPATAIIRVTTLWFAIAIGIAVFPLAEKYSLKGRDALEKI